MLCRHDIQSGTALRGRMSLFSVGESELEGLEGVVSQHGNHGNIDDRHRVFALGSSHGDDQIGWLLADLMEKDPVFSVSVKKLGSPWELLEHLESRQTAVIVDACCSGRSPGTILRLEPDQLDELVSTQPTTHGGNLREILQLAEALERLPSKVIVVAVEANHCQPGDMVSQQVRQALPALERLVRKELNC